ncbi:hypothetical protein BDN72DRAFT_905353 [Pluteus cervinus]|uniref:Uncharacterized protein n=1 Tax=Pluteus cervinus TaxID=181527 RepID=A0ACD3A2W6_9AGAR|nr:hypothetical protein BDN72DRAFT_905353 [Pluteus cervinus]
MSQPGEPTSFIVTLFQQVLAQASPDQRGMLIQLLNLPSTQPPPSQGVAISQPSTAQATSPPSPPGPNLPAPRPPRHSNLNSSTNTPSSSSATTMPPSNSQPVTAAYAPTQTRYTPVSRPMPLPAVPTTQPPASSSFQPHIGANTLPVSLTAPHTLHARELSAARASGPGGGGGRGRGRVVSTPVPSGSRRPGVRRPRTVSTPSIRGIQVSAGSTSRPPRTNADFAAFCTTDGPIRDGVQSKSLLMDIYIYPPSEAGYRQRSKGRELATHTAIYFKQLAVSFRRFSEDNKLFYAWDKDITTTIASLRIALVTQMKGDGYEFRPSDRARRLGVENTDLTLLSMGQKRLHQYPGDPDTLTLAKMLEKPTDFPPKKFGETGRFQVHFIITSSTTGRRIDGYLHRCLGPKYRNLYYDDCKEEDGAEEDQVVFSCDEDEGEENFGRDLYRIDEENGMEVDGVEFQAPLSSGSHLSSSRRRGGQNGGTSRPLEAMASTLSLDDSDDQDLPPLEAIPLEIWRQDQPWDRSITYRHKTLTEDIMKKVALEFFKDPLSNFHPVQGTDVDDLARQFIDFLKECARKNDYSDAYLFLSTCAVHDGFSSTPALGDGVGKEVLFRAFQLMKDKPAKYFSQTLDKFSSILVPQGGPRLFLMAPSKDLLLEFNILGALSAMMVAHGIPPLPFNPLVIQYMLHCGDLHSLTPPLVGEWHPGFRSTLEYFISLGAKGDLYAPCPFGNIESSPGVVIMTPLRSLFQCSMGMDVHLLDDRSEAAHSGWAVTLLLMAIFGTTDMNHPHIKAFYAGFSMRNYEGHTTQELFDQYSETTGQILSITWAGRIQDADQFLSHFRIWPTAGYAERDKVDDKLSRLDPPLNIKALMEGFFKRRGVPCMERFRDLTSHLTSKGLVLTPEEMNTHSFRSRLYTWVATGTPYLLPGDHDLELALVEDPSDVAYAQGTDSDREALMKAGVICWHTCTNHTMLPVAYLCELAEKTYPHDGYTSFVDAFDQWLLVQIVNGMCGHSGIL